MRRKTRACPTCGALLPERPNPTFDAPQEREVLRRLTRLENAVGELLERLERLDQGVEVGTWVESGPEAS